jgi:hypothetical protein
MAPAHIDVEAIARAQGAEIVYGHLRGATARVMRIGRNGVARIRVSDRITHPGVQRFSIAHELGHLVLGHELPTVADAVDPATVITRACERTRRNGVDQEAEADAFGAELLMPERLTRRQCEVSPVCLGPVRGIAQEFRTSLSASAIRFVELTSERCAAVYSERGAVSWAVRSPTFTATIERGVPLDRTSLAHDYFRTGTLDVRAQPVPAAAWIDHSGDVEIIEHSAALPDLRAVVSLLWVPESVAPRLRMFE